MRVYKHSKTDAISKVAQDWWTSLKNQQSLQQVVGIGQSELNLVIIDSKGNGRVQDDNSDSAAGQQGQTDLSQGDNSTSPNRSNEISRNAEQVVEALANKVFSVGNNERAKLQEYIEQRLSGVNPADRLYQINVKKLIKKSKWEISSDTKIFFIEAHDAYKQAESFRKAELLNDFFSRNTNRIWRYNEKRPLEAGTKQTDLYREAKMEFDTKVAKYVRELSLSPGSNKNANEITQEDSHRYYSSSLSLRFRRRKCTSY